MKTQDQTRRSFLKAAGQLTVLGGVITLGGCLGGCSTDSSSSFIIASTGVKATLVLANEPSLTNVGDSIRRVLGTNNNGRAVIVVHTADKKFRTMSTLCQHEGGSVQDPSSNKAICNLHQLPKEILLSISAVNLLLHFKHLRLNLTKRPVQLRLRSKIAD